MKRLSLFACVVLLGLGTTVALQTRSRTTPSDAAPSVVDQATNGAYRDGLYLGTLAAGRGTPYHVSVGRWAREEDRTGFTAGYQQGYATVGERNRLAASFTRPNR